ncbi:MAG: AbiV family abortive infection protein [Cyclobacteriaceae bacterium]
MKSLLQLGKEEAQKLHKELYSNSIVMTKTGQFAAGENNFGVALSLSILGVEELAKSVVIYLHSSGINIFKIKELQQIFFKHKRKHEFAMLFEILKVLKAFYPEKSPRDPLHLTDKITRWRAFYPYAVQAPVLQLSISLKKKNIDSLKPNDIDLHVTSPNHTEEILERDLRH